MSDVSLTGGAVKAPITASAGPDKEITTGGSTTLQGSATGGTPPYTIEWSPTYGLDDPQILEPTASPTITTEYTLTVTDSVNDSDSDSVQVTVSGIPGDFDGDGDVDQSDFGHMQVCLTGSSVPVTDPNCFACNFDGDSDVDGADMQVFLGCMSGANIPADPNCADGGESAPLGDFNEDGNIDSFDLEILADLYRDGQADLYDFAVLAQSWIEQ